MTFSEDEVTETANQWKIDLSTNTTIDLELSRWYLLKENRLLLSGLRLEYKISISQTNWHDINLNRPSYKLKPTI